MYQSGKLGSVAGVFIGSYQKHQAKMDEITGKDIGDGIRILFSPESGKMSELLTKLQTNILQLSSKDATEFNSPEDLIKFIFMGDKADETIKTSANSAKSTVNGEDVKALLKGIGIEDDQLTQLSTALDSISGTPTSPAPPAS